MTDDNGKDDVQQTDGNDEPIDVQLVPSDEAVEAVEASEGAAPVRGTFKPQIDLQQENRMTINHCYSCKGPHEDIPVYPYMTPHPPFTHYYLCPTTGDPTSLAIVHSNGDLVEANGEILRNLCEAQQAGAFMVLIAFMDQGRVELKRITNQFPTAEFPVVQGLIMQDFQQETGPPVRKTMEEAKPPKPADLFNNNN